MQLKEYTERSFRNKYGLVLGLGTLVLLAIAGFTLLFNISTFGYLTAKETQSVTAEHISGGRKSDNEFREEDYNTFIHTYEYVLEGETYTEEFEDSDEYPDETLTMLFYKNKKGKWECASYNGKKGLYPILIVGTVLFVIAFIVMIYLIYSINDGEKQKKKYVDIWNERVMREAAAREQAAAEEGAAQNEESKS